MSTDTIRDNLHSDYTGDNNFNSMLATFYPCFTGILAGANRAETLADPFESIPKGTPRLGLGLGLGLGGDPGGPRL